MGFLTEKIQPLEKWKESFKGQWRLGKTLLFSIVPFGLIRALIASYKESGTEMHFNMSADTARLLWSVSGR